MANLSNITNAYAAPQIVATGTLAAGQTDIGLSVSFPVNQYPSAQIGSVLVYVNGQLLLRNTGNATASLTADGNYQEVDSGTGVSSLIRLNVADPLNARPYAILSNGFNIAQPASTIQSQIQTLQTQQDNMATTLAEVAGISVSSLYTPLNDATRATFASQFNTLQSDAALKNVSNTFTQPQLIPGRTDGTAISAGYIGQRITWTTPPASQSITTTLSDWNNASISLTAGVWIIFANVSCNIFTNSANGSECVLDVRITDAANNTINSQRKLASINNPGSIGAIFGGCLSFTTMVFPSTTTVYKIRAQRIDVANTNSASLMNDGVDENSEFFAVRIA